LKKKLYTPLASSFSGMLNIRLSLFLLPNVNDKKEKIIIISVNGISENWDYLFKLHVVGLECLLMRLMLIQKTIEGSFFLGD